MKDPGFIDELTNWPNLLQGGLGGFVGALLGVAGAYGAAMMTVRRQRAVDRALFAQQLALEAARDVRSAVRPVEVSLLRLAVAEQLAGDVVNSWESVRAAKSHLDDVRDGTDSALPTTLIDLLDALDLRLFTLWENMDLREPLPALDDVGRSELSVFGSHVMAAHDAAQAALFALSHFRATALVPAKPRNGRRASQSQSDTQ